jgi:hypothetical protein
MEQGGYFLAIDPPNHGGDCSSRIRLPTIPAMKLSRPLLTVVILVAISSSLFARNHKDESQMSSTSFVVLKDDSGKPVRNAAIVLHPVGKNDKQGKAGFELKTDADGKTHFDGIPFGLLRVQVIAHGFQTFGSDYQISQANQEITIRLKRPQGQYSIYEKHDGSTSGTNTGGSNGTSGTTPPDKQ